MDTPGEAEKYRACDCKQFTDSAQTYTTGQNCSQRTIGRSKTGAMLMSEVFTPKPGDSAFVESPGFGVLFKGECVAHRTFPGKSCRLRAEVPASQAIQPNCYSTWLSSVKSTGVGVTFQMSRQYSSMVRSEENLPIRATFRIDMRTH